MVVSYTSGTITIQLAPSEQEICDHIFGRADGVGLVTFHLMNFLTQRYNQKLSDDSTSLFQAFKSLPDSDKQAILTKLNLKLG